MKVLLVVAISFLTSQSFASNCSDFTAKSKKHLDNSGDAAKLRDIKETEKVLSFYKQDLREVNLDEAITKLKADKSPYKLTFDLFIKLSKSCPFAFLSLGQALIDSSSAQNLNLKEDIKNITLSKLDQAVTNMDMMAAVENLKRYINKNVTNKSSDYVSRVDALKNESQKRIKASNDKMNVVLERIQKQTDMNAIPDLEKKLINEYLIAELEVVNEFKPKFFVIFKEAIN